MKCLTSFLFCFFRIEVLMVQHFLIFFSFFLLFSENKTLHEKPTNSNLLNYIYFAFYSMFRVRAPFIQDQVSSGCFVSELISLQKWLNDMIYHFWKYQF